MSDFKNYYALLGVPRNATLEQLRRAYREAALRLHPDKNVRPGDTELFLDVNQAYEVLSHPERRAEYDALLAEYEADQLAQASFHCSALHSRQALLRLDEPQVHYVLLDISAAENAPTARPPVNLCLVIDRSTSMRGPRLDQVRSAVLSILKDLGEYDSAVIVAFSDRAEVMISQAQAKQLSVARSRLSLLQAGGGTEIGQGLQLGLAELQHSLTGEGVNHLVLLTDGRTYGDEDLCVRTAEEAARAGITLHGVGIGADWSDRLLDDLAKRTGGSVVFMDTPRAITELLHQIYDSLSQTVARKIRLEGTLGQWVDLRSSFRLLPDPMPMGDTLPLVLGNLAREAHIRLLLEMVVQPLGEAAEVHLAELSVNGDLVGPGLQAREFPLPIVRPVSQDPDPNPPPDELVAALGLLSMYRMQERARHEAELGQAAQAARRLENLATQLLAVGEKELAKAALGEAERLAHTRRISLEGEKVLKFGTRALLLPARGGSS